MKTKFVLLVLFIILVLELGVVFHNVARKPVLIPTPTQAPTPTPAIISSDKLFQLVNEWRVQNGYKAYIYSDFTESIATRRLPEVKQNWSHTGFEADRFCSSECHLGENLSKGFLTESETLDAWLNSPGHRKNLENSFSHSAIVCDNTVENYCVHIFSYF